MFDLKEYALQVLAEGTWINYELCSTLQRAIRICSDELKGNSFRVLGYQNGKWVECLLSGSMLSVENKDFRMLVHKKGAVHNDSNVEAEWALSRV
jgi:hypothetical protein